MKKDNSNVDESQLIAYNNYRSESFKRRLSEVPGSIKTEEIDSKEHHFNDVLYLFLESTMDKLVYLW